MNKDPQNLTLATMLRTHRHVTADARIMASLHSDGLVTSPDPLRATLSEDGVRAALRVDLGPVWKSS
jgi:hypothetical protein